MSLPRRLFLPFCVASLICCLVTPSCCQRSPASLDASLPLTKVASSSAELLARPREMTISASSRFFAGVHGPPAAPPFLDGVVTFGLTSLCSVSSLRGSTLTFLRAPAVFLGVLTRLDDGGDGAKSDEASRSGVGERVEVAEGFMTMSPVTEICVLELTCFVGNELDLARAMRNKGAVVEEHGRVFACQPLIAFRAPGYRRDARRRGADRAAQICEGRNCLAT